MDHYPVGRRSVKTATSIRTAQTGSLTAATSSESTFTTGSKPVKTSSGTGYKASSKPRTDKHEFTFLGTKGIYREERYVV